MDKRTIIDLKPVTHITTDAIGAPGQRVFYIQGWKENEIITVIIEKFQVQTLMIGVEQFLAEVRQRLPDLKEAPVNFEEERMHIHPPVDPLFRVAEFGLSYDAEEDMVNLIVREMSTNNIPEEELEGSVVNFWCSREQIRAMIHWGVEVSNRGRPLCEQCGQPMDPEGHFCERKNGHKA